MAHSSLIPLGLPLGLIAGCITYGIVRASGAEVAESVMIAKWAGFKINLLVGGVKNVLMLDVISLMLMRPASALATLWAVAAIFTKT